MGFSWFPEIARGVFLILEAKKRKEPHARMEPVSISTPGGIPPEDRKDPNVAEEADVWKDKPQDRIGPGIPEARSQHSQTPSHGRPFVSLRHVKLRGALDTVQSQIYVYIYI